jgi:hypothetical protein
MKMLVICLLTFGAAACAHRGASRVRTATPAAVRVSQKEDKPAEQPIRPEQDPILRDISPAR